MFSAKCLILIYGYEGWSIYDKDDYNLCERDIIEKKTNLYFCINKFQVIINNVQMQPVEMNLVVWL